MFYELLKKLAQFCIPVLEVWQSTIGNILQSFLLTLQIQYLGNDLTQSDCSLGIKLDWPFEILYNKNTGIKRRKKKPERNEEYHARRTRGARVVLIETF